MHFNNQHVQENCSISSDHIIEEKVFARLYSIWYVLSTKCKYAECSYDKIFTFCFAETDSHNRIHPLIEEDGDFHRRSLKRLASISQDVAEKLRWSRERYRQRRRRRLEAEHRALRRSESGIKNEEEDILPL